jgi:hypothetical protein
VSLRRLGSFVVLVVACATFAPAAGADGLPVLGVDVGSSGVAAPDGSVRYVTIPAPGGTQVERIQRAGGRVLATRFFSRTITIPAVAYDGSASGLSGDRQTLVLIEPRTSFPRVTTSLLVLHARTLAYRSLVKLPGDFSFDAVSPDGSRLYLIQYLSPTDPTRYAVRSFDLASMRLEAKPIVDPREPDETMRGNPLSRAASVDGRWAYTLYDGGGLRPFIHALDTATATARCIDLDTLAPATVSRLRLRLGDGGEAVEIDDRAATVAVLDTRTFAVSAPAGRPSSRLLPLVGAAVAAIALALAAVLLWRRRRPAHEPIPVD